MQNVDMSKKNFFSFAIKFKEFTLEEVTIPAHILGNFTPIIREFCKFYKGIYITTKRFQTCANTIQKQ
ncbi:unnamed protein product [Rhizophagus irregularis]|nr:unnamed protein product [Rhizophagus irregularis]